MFSKYRVIRNLQRKGNFELILKCGFGKFRLYISFFFSDCRVILDHQEKGWPGKKKKKKKSREAGSQRGQAKFCRGATFSASGSLSDSGSQSLVLTSSFPTLGNPGNVEVDTMNRFHYL